MSDFATIFTLLSLIFSLIFLFIIPLIFSQNKEKLKQDMGERKRSIYRLNYQTFSNLGHRSIFIFPVNFTGIKLGTTAKNIEDLYVITNILKQKLSEYNYIKDVELEILPMGIKVSLSRNYFEDMTIVENDIRKALNTILLNQKYVVLKSQNGDYELPN